MSFMNSSRTTRIYNTIGKRQSLVFIGDSITYGAVLVQDQSYAFPYKIQQRINSKYGFTPATWGGGFMGQPGGSLAGIDIAARNISMDDLLKEYGDPTRTTSSWIYLNRQFTEGPPISPDGTFFDATFGMYPFSASTGISGRTIAQPSNEAIWNTGAITLGSPNGILRFGARYPSNQGYLIIGVMGAGQYQVLVNGDPIGGIQTTGAKFTATATSGSAILTNISLIYGSISTDSYIYADANALSSPYGDTANSVSSYTFPTLTMSVPSPVSGNYTFWTLEGSTKRVILGPFSTRYNGYNDAFEIRWVDFVPVFTMLHPTAEYPSTYTTVQVHGRNGYRIEDYSSEPNYPFSGNADVAAKQIMATVIHNDYDIAAGIASRPTYVLSVGVNDMSGTPVSDYKSRLKRLASALQNPNYRNYGRAVLTVPMNPIPGRGNFDAYRRAVIEVASELKCSYVDLSLLNLTSADYVGDGLHPNGVGTTKIANYYIKMLGL